MIFWKHFKCTCCVEFIRSFQFVFLYLGISKTLLLFHLCFWKQKKQTDKLNPEFHQNNLIRVFKDETIIEQNKFSNFCQIKIFLESHNDFSRFEVQNVEVWVNWIRFWSQSHPLEGKQALDDGNDSSARSFQVFSISLPPFDFANNRNPVNEFPIGGSEDAHGVVVVGRVKRVDHDVQNGQIVFGTTDQYLLKRRHALPKDFIVASDDQGLVSMFGDHSSVVSVVFCWRNEAWNRSGLWSSGLTFEVEFFVGEFWVSCVTAFVVDEKFSLRNDRNVCQVVCDERQWRKDVVQLRQIFGWKRIFVVIGSVPDVVAPIL